MPRHIDFGRQEVNRRRQPEFLSTIARFTGFLDRHIAQQQNIANQTFELQQKQRGQQLAEKFGGLIKNTSDPIELSKIATEGVTQAFSLGLRNTASEITNIANLRSSGLGIEQDRAFAISSEKELLKIHGKTEIKSGEGTTTLGEFGAGLDLSLTPPERLATLNQALISGKLTTQRKIGVNEAGDPTGGIFQLDTSGNIVGFERFIGNDGKVFIDRGELGLFEEDTDIAADPSVQAEYTDLLAALRRNQRTEDRANQRIDLSIKSAARQEKRLDIFLEKQEAINIKLQDVNKAGAIRGRTVQGLGAALLEFDSSIGDEINSRGFFIDTGQLPIKAGIKVRELKEDLADDDITWESYKPKLLEAIRKGDEYF